MKLKQKLKHIELTQSQDSSKKRMLSKERASKVCSSKIKVEKEEKERKNRKHSKS